MNPLTRKAFLSEGADLFRGLMAFQIRVSQLAKQPLDATTVEDLSVMHKHMRECQRSLTRCIAVVIRETEKESLPPAV